MNNISSFSNYYPFGMLLPNRHESSNEYRYGYQGSESDSEVKGEGNSYTTHFRQLDPRIGRWMSIDPVVQAWQSPYNSMDNNPIWFNDPLGDKVKYKNKKKDKKAVKSAIKSNPEFKADFKELKKSKETYVFSGSNTNENNNIGTDGKDVFINYQFNSTNNALGDGEATSLMHETEHAIQFEHGEIGFRNVGKNTWTAINYDLTDEMGAMKAGSFASGTKIKNSKGNNTFQGDLRSLGSDFSKPSVTLSNARLILKWYKNNPKSSYHGLEKSAYNNTQTNEKIKNTKYYMLPYTSRGR
jgi:RHS repeat-associated protein